MVERGKEASLQESSWDGGKAAASVANAIGTDWSARDGVALSHSEGYGFWVRERAF